MDERADQPGGFQIRHLKNFDETRRKVEFGVRGIPSSRAILTIGRFFVHKISYAGRIYTAGIMQGDS
jgi:hypothetical protein